MGGFVPNMLPRRPGMGKANPNMMAEGTGGWGAPSPMAEMAPPKMMGSTGMLPPPMMGGTGALPRMQAGIGDLMGARPPQPPMRDMGGFGAPPPRTAQRGMGRRPNPRFNRGF